jgi:hypothetical protein
MTAARLGRRHARSPAWSRYASGRERRLPVSRHELMLGSVDHVDQLAQCRDVLAQGLPAGPGQPDPLRASPRLDALAAADVTGVGQHRDIFGRLRVTDPENGDLEN